MPGPAYPLSRLAAILDLPFPEGDDPLIRGVNTLENAGPDDLSFLAKPRYARLLADTGAGAVIVRPEHATEVRRALVCADPYQAFARAVALFAVRQGWFSGISPLAFIHPEARLGEKCTVYPFVHIGPRSRLGDG